MNFPDAATVEDYLSRLPADRLAPFGQLVDLFRDALPPGFTLVMQYGMPTFVVPLERYPAGYHCQKGTPLPFLGLASQKNHLAVYHMGLYAEPGLLDWFDAALKNDGLKPDIGKSCVRLNPAKPLPLRALRELAGKLTVDEWIALYETRFRQTPGKKS